VTRDETPEVFSSGQIVTRDWTVGRNGTVEGLGYLQKEPTVLYSNNQSVINLTRDAQLQIRLRHFDVQNYFVCEKVENGIIDLPQEGLCFARQKLVLKYWMISHSHVLLLLSQINNGPFNVCSVTCKFKVYFTQCYFLWQTTPETWEIICVRNTLINVYYTYTVNNCRI